MLGVTSYQEALRAIARMVGPATMVRIAERATVGVVDVSTGAESKHISSGELEDVVVASLLKRGEHRPVGETSDILRAVGLALDELHAGDVCVELGPGALTVQYVDPSGQPRELGYAGEELEGLRRSAAARRNGQPLRRILILQTTPSGTAGLREVLVAEFAVQALPTAYARAIAATAEPPDLILAEFGAGTVDAVRALRAGATTAAVPILVVTTADHREAFAAGADDVVQEPLQAAQLRARIRTLLLRSRG
jgi:CheY-like chemotaxis protein